MAIHGRSYDWKWRFPSDWFTQDIHKKPRGGNVCRTWKVSFPASVIGLVIPISLFAADRVTLVYTFTSGSTLPLWVAQEAGLV